VATTVGRYLGLVLTVVYGVLAGAVLVHDLVHPGDWHAMLLVACWMAPMVALAALAVLRPQRAGPVLGWTTAAVVEIVLLVASVGLVPGDLGSHVCAVLVFITAVPLGFLGLRRPLFAGAFLLALGGAFWLAVLLGSVIAGARMHDLVLTGWGDAVGLPVLVLGAVFLLAAAFQRPPRMIPLPSPPPPRGRRPGTSPPPRGRRAAGSGRGRAVAGPWSGRGRARSGAVGLCERGEAGRIGAWGSSSG